MKTYHYASVVMAVTLILIIALFMFTSQPKTSPEGACKVILENEGEKKTDMVFLTNEVEENKVEEYIDYFLNSEPFVNNKKKFNFYYAGQSEECEIVKDNLLLCYSRDLIKKAGVCKNDYVVVLSKHPSNIRSTAYMNVMSINIRHPKTVLLHEFGHVFANLADEYVPSVLPSGSENCQGKCERFDVIDSCNEGCCKDSLFRSSHSSVMRTLNTPDYKKLNTKLINEKLVKYE